MAHQYHAHGLTISSTLELRLPPASPAPGTPDLVLQWGAERPVSSQDPPGCLLAALRRPDGTLRYGLARDGDRTVLRYPELCDFVGDRDLTDVTVHLRPGADPDLVPVLAAGALLAVHLRLHGELVLHASAVQVDDGALAFVGASGMGKSTLAALLCAGGRGLVTDDVLRVDQTDSAVVGHPGAIETRLRVKARQLTDTAPTGAVRTTADGRLALRPQLCTSAPVPLLACLIPRPSRDVEQLSVVRLTAARAVVRMLQFPRIVGWIEPRSTAHEFQAIADLVERVPIFEITIPWGPPFAPEIVTGLLEAVDGCLGAVSGRRRTAECTARRTGRP